MALELRAGSAHDESADAQHRRGGDTTDMSSWVRANLSPNMNPTVMVGPGGLGGKLHTGPKERERVGNRRPSLISAGADAGGADELYSSSSEDERPSTSARAHPRVRHLSRKSSSSSPSGTSRSRSASRTRRGSLSREREHNHVQAYAKIEFASCDVYVRKMRVIIGRRPASSSSGQVSVSIKDENPGSKRTAESTSSSAGESELADIDLGQIQAVSRRHAAIYFDFDMGCWALEVLGRNGVILNGIWMALGEKAPLQQRAQIRIAERIFYFVLPADVLQRVDAAQRANAAKRADAVVADDDEEEDEEEAADDYSTPTGADSALSPSGSPAVSADSNHPVSVIGPNGQPLPPRRGRGRPPKNGVCAQRTRKPKPKADAQSTAAAVAGASGYTTGDASPQALESLSMQLLQQVSTKHAPSAADVGAHALGYDVQGPSVDAPKVMSKKHRDNGKPLANPPTSHLNDEGIIYPIVSLAARAPESDRTAKPPYTYASLIAQAVTSAPNHKLTLNGIYDWITSRWPYFTDNSNGWQNSIRHNLTLSRGFVKLARRPDEQGKGAFWALDPLQISNFDGLHFRKKPLPKAKEFPDKTPAPTSGKVDAKIKISQPPQTSASLPASTPMPAPQAPAAPSAPPLNTSAGMPSLSKDMATSPDSKLKAPLPTGGSAHSPSATTSAPTDASPRTPSAQPAQAPAGPSASSTTPSGTPQSPKPNLTPSAALWASSTFTHTPGTNPTVNTQGVKALLERRIADARGKGDMAEVQKLETVMKKYFGDSAPAPAPSAPAPSPGAQVNPDAPAIVFAREEVRGSAEKFISFAAASGTLGASPPHNVPIVVAPVPPSFKPPPRPQDAEADKDPVTHFLRENPPILFHEGTIYLVPLIFSRLSSETISNFQCVPVPTLLKVLQGLAVAFYKAKGKFEQESSGSAKRPLEDADASQDAKRATLAM